MAWLRKYIDKPTFGLIVGLSNLGVGLIAVISPSSPFGIALKAAAPIAVNLFLVWLGLETQAEHDAETK